jgi:DNA-binding MarR family transcriptional regulator
MSQPDRPLSRYALADCLDNDPEAMRLVMDMLKATTRYPQGHAAGFQEEPVWTGSVRTASRYFLGMSGAGDPYFENNRILKRDIVPTLREAGFIEPSKYPNIQGGFWQFTPKALDWYRDNSGPSDDEVRKKIGRIIADTDPLNEWSSYQAEALARDIEISPERATREVSVLVNAGFLERRKSRGSELGWLRFTSPKGVVWAAADFPPIAGFGTHQTNVTVSVSVQVTAIIEQAREANVSKEQLLQFEALLQRAAAELEKPPGKGKFEAIKDLVAFAANIKELVPLAGQFVAENGDKIQGLSDAVGNIFPG